MWFTNIFTIIPYPPSPFTLLSQRLNYVLPQDRHILGELSPTPPNQTTIGHGTAGTVLEAGLKCHLEPGTKVAIYLITPCHKHKCAYCKERQYKKCIRSDLHRPHTTGSVITLPRALVVPLPIPLTLEEGALIQVLALAVKLVNTADPKPGQSFAVLGVSCIGILCCLLARARGVRQIMVADHDEGLLDVARRFVRFSGTTDETVAAIACVVPKGTDATEGAAALVKAFGREPDICVNATGEYELMKAAYKAVKAGGVYVHAGVRESEVSWDVLEMWRDDVKVHGGVGCEDLNYEEAVNMVMKGEVSLREFCHQG